jgi:hypothetical protein
MYPFFLKIDQNSNKKNKNNKIHPHTILEASENTSDI